jgi:hypothetical protein
MIDGLELVSRLIAQYAQVEKLYFHHGMVLQEHLEDCMIDLYAAILAYLSRAKEYYDRRTAGVWSTFDLPEIFQPTNLGRLARSIVQSSSSIDKSLRTIEGKAKRVDDITRVIDTDCAHGPNPSFLRSPYISHA